MKMTVLHLTTAFLISIYAGFAQPQFSGSARVMITSDALPIEKAQPTTVIQWTAPRGGAIYCVGSSDAGSLEFVCLTCNSSAQSDYQFQQEITSKTRDMTGQAGFTLIKLDQPLISSNVTGKTIRCQPKGIGVSGNSGSSGQFMTNQQQQNQFNNNQQQFGNQQFGNNQQQTQGRPNQFQNQQQQQQFQNQQQQQQLQNQQQQQQLQNQQQFQQQQTPNYPYSDATLSVSYIDTPLILNDHGQRPVYSQQEGYRFYVSQGQALSLNCYVNANPPPSQIQWFANARQIGSGSTISLDYRYVNQVVLCRAWNSVISIPAESDQVFIAPWVQPQVVSNDFNTIDANSKPINSQVAMQCMAAGLPAPMVIWQQALGTGGNIIVNASCSEGIGALNPVQVVNQPTDQNPVWQVSSRCTLRITDYEYVGRYWCMACNQVAEGMLSCNPPNGTISNQIVSVSVQGAPVFQKDQPLMEQNQDGSEARLAVNYCAYPRPTEVYWDISGERLTPPSSNQNSDHYQALATVTNTTINSCYQNVLVIRPVRRDDASKTYRITVKNSIGEVTYTVPMNLNGSGGTSGGGENLGLAIGLPIGLAILLALIILAVCWWQKCCCFSPTKKKSNGPSKYQSNIAPPSGVRAEPAPLPRKSPPPSNDSFGSSELKPEMIGTNEKNEKNGFRTSHEGLTYAELDLIKDSQKPLTRPVTNYAQFRPGLGYSSPTNSVV